MITVNDKRFKTYVLDSVEDIKERISTTFFEGTPIRYLVFQPALLSPSQTGNFRVLNVLAPFLNQETLDFPLNAYERFKETLKREDAEKLFISTNITLEKAFREGGHILLIALKDIENSNPREIWDTRARIHEKYVAEQRALREKVASKTHMILEFETTSIVAYDELEPERIQVSLTFKPFNTTLNDVFNRMALTKFIPYINYRDLWKIRYDFSPNLEWLDYEAENAILLKIDGEMDDEMRGLKNIYKKYTTAAFTVVKTPDKNQIVGTIDLYVDPRNVDKKELISRVLSSIDLPHSAIEKIEDVSWTGYFSIPRQQLLIPVWTELAMNNKYFNSVLVVNEFVQSSKTKENVYMHILPEKNKFDTTLKISMKFTEQGAFFIRARIKSQSTLDAMKYQDMVGRLFTIYNNEKDGIIQEYRKYIPKFLTEDRKTPPTPRDDNQSDLQALRSIEPELFLPTYSRKCVEKPRIVSDALRDEYERTKQYEVMQFPVFGEGTTRNYICDHPTHPFPGLRTNTMENVNQYKFIPCCYTKDQKTKPGSKYIYYFEKLPDKETRIATPDLFFTDKILAQNMTGVLPKTIKRLFSLIQADADYCFVRVGSHNTSKSVIESVLRGLHIDTSPSNVNRVFQTFLSVENSMASKQELYDEDAETILKYMRENLKASTFAHAIEETFDVDVFVFSSDELIVPRHSQMYLKAAPTRNVIFLFQHKRTGGEGDVKHNQCEIIARVRSDNAKHLDRQYIFSHEDTIVKEVWKLFNKMTQTLSLQHNTTQLIPQITFTRRFQNIISQRIDMYGKCRLLNVAFRSDVVSFVCDPLPPFAVRSATNINRTSNIEIVREFASTHNIKLLDQVIDDTFGVCEVNAMMCGTHRITFLVRFPRRLDLPTSTDTPKYSQLFQKPANDVTIFGHNQKIAKLLYQYALYILSIYMWETKITSPLANQQFVEFVRTKIVIDPTFQYSDVNISSTFDLTSQFIRDRTKLILPSNETLKRILFMLKLYQSTRFKELIMYRTHVIIDKYFDNIGDYDPLLNGILIQGKQTVHDLIYVFSHQNILVDYINIHEKTYFFRNKLISNRVYLAQNYSTLDDAVKATVLQHRVRDTRDVAIYTFRSSKDIELISGSPHYGIILGCKINGESVYTSLLMF